MRVITGLQHCPVRAPVSTIDRWRLVRDGLWRDSTCDAGEFGEQIDGIRDASCGLTGRTRAAVAMGYLPRGTDHPSSTESATSADQQSGYSPPRTQ